MKIPFLALHTVPNTRYKIHLSAATSKGEGVRSDALLVDTDYSGWNYTFYHISKAEFPQKIFFTKIYRIQLLVSHRG